MAIAGTDGAGATAETALNGAEAAVNNFDRVDTHLEVSLPPSTRKRTSDKKLKPCLLKSSGRSRRQGGDGKGELAGGRSKETPQIHVTTAEDVR